MEDAPNSKRAESDSTGAISSGTQLRQRVITAQPVNGGTRPTPQAHILLSALVVRRPTKRTPQEHRAWCGLSTKHNRARRKLVVKTRCHRRHMGPNHLHLQHSNKPDLVVATIDDLSSVTYTETGTYEISLTGISGGNGDSGVPRTTSYHFCLSLARRVCRGDGRQCDILQ